MTGMNRVKNRVIGSRRMWSSSLRATVRMRCDDFEDMGGLLYCFLSLASGGRKPPDSSEESGGLRPPLALLRLAQGHLCPRQCDKHVFEVGVGGPRRGAAQIERTIDIDQGVNRLAEDGRLAHAGTPAQPRQQPRGVR